MSCIVVRGASEHNLKNINLDIPKKKLVIFTGMSGSGKSSLVFDTLYVESFRRFIDASVVPVYMLGSSALRKQRPAFREIKGLPPALGLSQKQGVSSPLSTVGTVSSVSDLLRVYFSAFGESFCRACQIPLKPLSFPELITRVFSDFPEKKVDILAVICEKRKGGFQKEIESFKKLGFSKLFLNGKSFSLQEDAIKVDHKKLNTIEILLDILTVSPDKKARLERTIQQALKFGQGMLRVRFGAKDVLYNTLSTCPQCGESAKKLDPRFFSHSSLGQCETCHGIGSQNETMPYPDLYPCGSCHGSRLKVIPVKALGGKSKSGYWFSDLQNLSLSDLYHLVKDEGEVFQGNLARQRVLEELLRLLDCLCELGLSHLTSNRPAWSLSPGDLQRIRLSSMFSNRLQGALYILDEPCQGLTKKEVHALSVMLKRFVKRGASIVCVEHHPEFLKEGDVVFVMGPKAGDEGGEIVAQTTGPLYYDSLAFPPLAAKKKEGSFAFRLNNIKIRNLKLDQLSFFDKRIHVIRGTSGSGKSTLMDVCLAPLLLALQEGRKETSSFYDLSVRENLQVEYVVDVRPGSLKRSSRRTVAAALDILKNIRDLFSALEMSQILGLTSQHFSWHSKIGQCPHCQGRGYLEIGNKWQLRDLTIECDVCSGTKLSSQAFVPRFKGQNFYDVLQMSLSEAKEFFSNQKRIVNPIKAACDFGLGYIKLGQSLGSLSGGELQRLILTTELTRASLEHVWFILSHPGTGLHLEDIVVLKKIMTFMVEKGATFILMENREEFIDDATEVIDLDLFPFNQ